MKIKVLKQAKNNNQLETKEIKSSTHVQIKKKRVPDPCVLLGPRKNHRTDETHKLHRLNHGHFIILQKTLEDKIRFQSDSA